LVSRVRRHVRDKLVTGFFAALRCDHFERAFACQVEERARESGHAEVGVAAGDRNGDGLRSVEQADLYLDVFRTEVAAFLGEEDGRAGDEGQDRNLGPCRGCRLLGAACQTASQGECYDEFTYDCALQKHIAAGR
jgi:hypothetical protein